MKKLPLEVNFLNGYVTTKARQFHESIAMSLHISNRSPIIETQDQNTASSDSSSSSKDTHPTSQAPLLLNKPPTTDPDKWYDKAAKQGVAEAANKLGKLKI